HDVRKPCTGAEAALEELWHGVETVTQVIRQEHPKQCVEPDDDRPPHDQHRGEATVVSRAHDSYEMVAADVGGNNAAANHPPGELVTREKVVTLGFAAAPRGQHSDHQHRQQISHEDGDV